MGMNQDPRGDAYGRSPERPDAPAPAGRAPQGSRGKITTRPSRESILQSYATQDEMRARDARLRSQQASRAYTASAAQRDADRAARREALAAQQREQEARSRRPAASRTRNPGPARRPAPNARGAAFVLPGKLRPHPLLHGELRARPRLSRCSVGSSAGPRAQPRGHRRPGQYRLAHLQREPPDFRLLPRRPRPPRPDDRCHGQPHLALPGWAGLRRAPPRGLPALRRPRVVRAARVPPTSDSPAS